MAKGICGPQLASNSIFRAFQRVTKGKGGRNE